MDAKRVGKFIADIRKENGLTQKQLAQKLNVSNKAISRWETGRGFPDVESLLNFSELFSVSVNEILYGKRIENEKIEEIADKNIISVIDEAFNHKKKIKKTVIVVTLIMFITVSVFSIFEYAKNIMGSKACVVASNYKSFTYYGQKYVQLDMGEYSCDTSTLLVEEAKVEGTFLLQKLFFGDSVYSIDGCSTNELLYLNTDRLSNRVYCLESKFEFYKNCLENAQFDNYYVKVIDKDWTEHKIKLSNEVISEINNLEETDRDYNVNCDYNRSKGDESIEVIAYDKGGVFYKSLGELLRKNGQYYWFDYSDIPPERYYSYYEDAYAYKFSDDIREILDKYFAYMFQ